MIKGNSLVTFLLLGSYLVMGEILKFVTMKIEGRTHEKPMLCGWHNHEKPMLCRWHKHNQLKIDGVRFSLDSTRAIFLGTLNHVQFVGKFRSFNPKKETWLPCESNLDK